MLMTSVLSMRVTATATSLRRLVLDLAMRASTLSRFPRAKGFFQTVAGLTSVN